MSSNLSYNTSPRVALRFFPPNSQFSSGSYGNVLPHWELPHTSLCPDSPADLELPSPSGENIFIFSCQWRKSHFLQSGNSLPNYLWNRLRRSTPCIQETPAPPVHCNSTRWQFVSEAEVTAQERGVQVQWHDKLCINFPFPAPVLTLGKFWSRLFFWAAAAIEPGEELNLEKDLNLGSQLNKHFRSVKGI